MFCVFHRARWFSDWQAICHAEALQKARAREHPDIARSWLSWPTFVLEPRWNSWQIKLLCITIVYIYISLPWRGFWERNSFYAHLDLSEKRWSYLAGFWPVLLWTFWKSWQLGNWERPVLLTGLFVSFRLVSEPESLTVVSNKSRELNFGWPNRINFYKMPWCPENDG